MELGYILRRAWRITWEHKLLWIFGILVSTGMVSTRLGLSSGQWEAAVQELPPGLQQPIVDFMNGPYAAAVAAALAVLGFIVGFGLSLLSVLGRVGLVHQVRAVEEYGVAVLKGGWLAGKQRLWQAFFARLLLALPAGLVVFIGALPAVVAWLLTVGQEQLEAQVFGVLTTGALGLICLAPATFLSLLLSLPIGVLQRLAVRACVLEKLGVRASVARAWGMLRESPGWLALVWLILAAISAGAMILVGLPLVAVWWLLFSTAWLAMFFSPLFSVILMLLLGLATWVVASAIGGLLETFSSTTWTLAYRELTGMGRTGEEVALSV
ncbi:MAG: hypothetical protein JW918_03535 [Anaerolineae bacterium]|nr:hypothetical protein [Anaerolineae bacterium]